MRWPSTYFRLRAHERDPVTAHAASPGEFRHFQGPHLPRKTSRQACQYSPDEFAETSDPGGQASSNLLVGPPGNFNEGRAAHLSAVVEY